MALSGLADQLLVLGGAASGKATIRRLPLRVIIIEPRDAEADPIRVPVVDGSRPAKNLCLKPGDTIRLLPLPENRQQFTVLGQVRETGSFSYPPEADYSLWQGLARAGGPDPLQEPRKLTVYRQDQVHEAVTVTFPLNAERKTMLGEMPLKPGDVLEVH